MSEFENRSNKEELDLGLKISPAAQGFQISLGESAVREDDVLLISYQASGGDWTHLAERFKRGMSVNTSSTPEHVVIFTQREVEAVLKLSEAARTVYPEANFLHLGDPFSILSPSSPFHVFHLNDDPRAFLEMFDFSEIERQARQEASNISHEQPRADLHNLQSPTQKKVEVEDDGSGETDPPSSRRRHHQKPTPGASTRDIDDPSYRSGGRDPYRSDDVVIPIVIINQDTGNNRDPDRAARSPGQTEPGQGPDGSSVPFGQDGDKATTPFGESDDDKATAPFGSEEEGDKATALFGGGKEGDFASAPFGASEPSAYK